jgi:hypothetical protein
MGAPFSGVYGFSFTAKLFDCRPADLPQARSLSYRVNRSLSSVGGSSRFVVSFVTLGNATVIPKLARNDIKYLRIWSLGVPTPEYKAKSVNTEYY